MESGQGAHQERREPLAEAYELLLTDGWSLEQIGKVRAGFQRHLADCETGQAAYVLLATELPKRYGKPRTYPRRAESAAPRRRRGKKPLPWSWFQKAGVPKSWFTYPEQLILRLVHQVHTLEMGWGEHDTDKACREGFELFPSKIARVAKCSHEYARAACRLLIRAGFLRVIDAPPGRPRLVVSGWWHGPDAEAENVAALRECFARLRELRPSRPIPTGKSGQKRPKSRGAKSEVTPFRVPGQYRGQYRGQYPGTGFGVTESGEGDSPLRKGTESESNLREKSADAAKWAGIREISRRQGARRVAKKRKPRKGSA